MSNPANALASPVWHPFTQMKTAAPALHVVSGAGAYLTLLDGREILDCISSWWVNLHGHCHPQIADAIYKQALQLEHVIFAGFTHTPAESLARRLLSKLPAQFKHVFYSDNGSTAVEIALKMSYQYWQHQDKAPGSRCKFIAFDGGYHGDTLGAMALGAGSQFWRPFAEILCAVDIAPYPETFDGDDKVEEKENLSIATIRSLLDENPQDYAAIFIEPLVQGSGGMRMCRPQFLEKLALTCREYDLLLVFDEVMTGFGRTGNCFATSSISENLQPDIICLSKGITGGFMPLAATVTSAKIYQSFLHDSATRAFLHGHSYTANPLACAAALASLDLLEDNHLAYEQMEQRHRQAADILATKSNVKRLRFCGTIMALDIASGDEGNYFGKLSASLKTQFLQRGFLIRPLGGTIYLLPPYCITDQQLESAYVCINDVISSKEYL